MPKAPAPAAATGLPETCQVAQLAAQADLLIAAEQFCDAVDPQKFTHINPDCAGRFAYRQIDALMRAAMVLPASSLVGAWAQTVIAHSAVDELYEMTSAEGSPAARVVADRLDLALSSIAAVLAVAAQARLERLGSYFAGSSQERVRWALEQSVGEGV